MKSSENIERLKTKIKSLEEDLENQHQKISLKTIFSSKYSGKDGCGVSLSLLSKLIDSSVDGIIAADKAGNLLVFNAAAAAIYGYEIEEALSTLNIRDLYPKAGACEVMAKLRSDGYGGPGKLAGYLVNVLDKEGELVPVRMNASIVYENEAEIATIGYLRDLRDSSQLTDGAQSMQAAGQDVSLDEYLTSVTRQLKFYDQQFCVGAIKNDLATVKQVKQVLHKQSEILEKAKVHVPIGRIMIQLGIMTEVQRDAILNLYRMGSRNQTSASRLQENTKAQKEWTLDRTVTLEVSADRLEATVCIATDSDHSVSRDDLHGLLKERGVAFGTVADAAIEAFLNSEPADTEPFAIAKGQPPVSETPPQINYHFSTAPLGIGTAREDGSIDWKNRGKLPQARIGDVLAEITPGSPGVGGMDIFGDEIPPPTVKPDLPKSGKGVAFSEDGSQYLAKLNGLVFLEDHRLSLVETLVVEEDVGLETGHIDFDGHVEVKGSIHKGYRVSCKSLRVGDIHEAEITVAGDMVVMGGIYEGTIRCKGGLQASQVRKSQVRVGCDLVVQKEIAESTIESSGQCMIEEGTIVLSQISARDGVVAANLGTKGSKPSTLFVGIDQRTKRKIKYTKNKLVLQKKDLDLLPGEIEDLEERLQNMEVEKTDLSKTLSCHAERVESMEAQLKMLEAKGRKADVSKMGTIIGNLISEKERLESHLQSLDKDMEKLSERAFQKHDHIEKGQKDLKLLEDKLEALIAEKASHGQRAVVRVSGSVYSGTTVTGPRASLTIDDDVASLVVKEVRQVDENGKETVVMQMNALN
jgi:PAS domain S-box-containing protein